MKNHHSESFERALSNYSVRVTIKLFLSIPLIFALFILYPANHFKTGDHELFWQKVYYSRLTFEQLREKVKEAGIFDKIEISDNKITGELRLRDFDYRILRRPSVPMYLKANKYTGFVTIDSQKGKYTVTCSRMVLINQVNNIPAEQRKNINLEKYALKNGTNHLKEPFEKNTGKVLEYTFTDMFAFR